MGAGLGARHLADDASSPARPLPRSAASSAASPRRRRRAERSLDPARASSSLSSASCSRTSSSRSRHAAGARRSGPRCRTRSTSSPSASRPASDSTPPSQKLTEHMEGPLIEEFALALGEMRIGETRAKALQKMVDRVAGARARLVRPRDHPGRPARYLPGPHPARAGDRHEEQASGRRRGEGHEGADQDALPDRALHLPVDVPRSSSGRPS